MPNYIGFIIIIIKKLMKDIAIQKEILFYMSTVMHVLKMNITIIICYLQSGTMMLIMFLSTVKYHYAENLKSYYKNCKLASDKYLNPDGSPAVLSAIGYSSIAYEYNDDSDLDRTRSGRFSRVLCS